MALELRELKGDDIFPMLAIVGKLNMKDEFVNMFKKNTAVSNVIPMDHLKKEPTKAELKKIEELQAKKAKEATERGIEAGAALLQKVLMNISTVKNDLNSFLADLSGKTVAEIQDLSLIEYTGTLIAFFKKPELADFFSSIASLLS
ncbi:hypothetical protein [Enterococcus nangangensis]|uniref:hypothetical protein n=1 Tax=Enterococcus nangangensis TaxID=2559926 RepID=UPI0010F51079|nr:hypothetical protein [Enterococcus nangangensis]